jgi:hypothetical protein
MKLQVSVLYIEEKKKMAVVPLIVQEVLLLLAGLWARGRDLVQILHPLHPT